MCWENLEKYLGENVPVCIKKILTSCGYNTLISLQSITSDSIARIESHINENCTDVIHELDCCYHDFYKAQKTFKFLPGHYDFLINLAKYIDNSSNVECDYFNLMKSVKNHSGFSKIMKELIFTSLQNDAVSKNNACYSDIVRYFATYIFTLCGRSCYEVLYQNLPLPSISTICKLSDDIHHVVKVIFILNFLLLQCVVSMSKRIV